MKANSRHHVIALLAVIVMILAACGGSSESTSGPEQSGQSGTQATAQSSGQTTTPTTSSQTHSMTADRLILVTEAEPETLFIRDACSVMSDLVMDNVYESLTQRTRDGQVVGQLAESFERIDDTRWRFHLRQGITFHNGEPFNADAVLAAVDYYLNPDVTSRCSGTWSTIQWPAEKVDDYTVDLVTTGPDPLLPTRILKMRIMAPEWAASTPDDEVATTAVGTGPYTLAEWARGSHVLLRTNENYWGDNKPKISEVQIIGRSEASVRVSMLEAGEAHIAQFLPPEVVSQVPNTVIEPTMEAIGIRLNTAHPVLKDVRVRKAIALAIDVDAIIDTMFPGFATRLNGQMDRDQAFGHNPNLEPYPYDPDQARALIQEAGASGTELNLIVRVGGFPLATEVGEAIANMLTDVGLKVSPVNLEADAWREQLYAVQPGQPRSDMLMTGATNNLFDSSRTLEAYYGTGRFSHQDDEEINQLIKDAAFLSGDERERAYQEIWETVYEDYYMVPLFGMDFVHGLSPDVSWEPRGDGFTYFSDMELVK